MSPSQESLGLSSVHVAAVKKICIACEVREGVGTSSCADEGTMLSSEESVGGCRTQTCKMGVGEVLQHMADSNHRGVPATGYGCSPFFCS